MSPARLAGRLQPLDRKSLKSKKTLIFTLIVLFINACDDAESPRVPDKGETPIEDYGPAPTWWDTIIVDTTRIKESPMENKEIENMALHLSRDLVAPANLYQRLLRDVSLIRSEYAVLSPELKGNFVGRWVSNHLLIRLSEDGVKQYNDGTLKEFAELNALFGVEQIVGDTLRGPRVLVFRPRLNPFRVGEFYKNIESVVEVGPNWGMGGGANRLYPWYANNKLTYLFREGWGTAGPVASIPDTGISERMMLVKSIT